VDEDEDDLETDYDSEDDDGRSSVSSFTRELDKMHCFGFESSYLHGRPPSTPYAWHRNEIIYDLCTAKELKSFVNERGLSDPFPAGLTLKWYYLPVLEQADRARSFRFMDLPLEMREIIYTDLLTVPGEVCMHHKFCFPQILRTCKQVRDEATKVLYSVNIIDCTFAAACCSSHHFAKTVYLHRDLHQIAQGRRRENPSKFELLPEGLSAYPAWFRRIRHLRIGVSVSLLHEDDSALTSHWAPHFINKCLLTLTSFLMDDHCLKSLEVNYFSEIDELNEYDYDSASRMLYPLRRLRNISRVQINGLEDDDVAASISTEMQSPDRAYNTLKHYALLRDEARAYRKLCATIEPPRYDDTDNEDGDLSALVSETFMNVQAHFHTRDNGGIRTLQLEQQIQKQMATLQSLLDRSRIQEQVDVLAASRKARSQYLQQTHIVSNPMSAQAPSMTIMSSPSQPGH